MPGDPRLQALSDEQKVVYTVLLDRARGFISSALPGTAQEIAADTAWPGKRTFGVARTRRILGELRTLGLVTRKATRAEGVRWSLRYFPHGADS